jgi:hypothetical protein
VTLVPKGNGVRFLVFMVQRFDGTRWRARRA